EDQRQQVAVGGVVERRGSRVSVLLEVPAGEQLLGLRGSPLHVHFYQVGDEGPRPAVLVVQLDVHHVLDGQAAVCDRSFQQRGDPLGTVAVVPVHGEQVRVPGVHHRLVGGDNEPRIRVDDGGQ